MALLFVDSFDHYAQADLAEKWTQRYTAGGSSATTQIGATGRRSSNGYRATATSTGGGSRTPALGRVLTPSGSTCIVGCFFASSVFSALDSDTSYDPPNSSSSTANGIVSVRQAGITHVWFHLNPTGTITAYRGTTALGTTSAALTLSTGNYLEFKVTIHNSAGAVVIKKDGVTILDLSAIDTNNGVATDTWDEVVIARIQTTGSTTITWDYDDLYIADGSGAAPWNDFLGDVRIDVRYPTAEGTSSQWTPSSGIDNALLLDETAPNDDTDYTSTSTVGQKDTHVVQDAPVVGAAILGVQVNLSAKKTDAGACTLAPVVRHSGTDYQGTAQNPSTAYGYLIQTYQTNPGTSAQWTEAHFNAAEVGYIRTA